MTLSTLKVSKCLPMQVFKHQWLVELHRYRWSVDCIGAKDWGPMPIFNGAIANGGLILVIHRFAIDDIFDEPITQVYLSWNPALLIIFVRRCKSGVADPPKLIPHVNLLFAICLHTKIMMFNGFLPFLLPISGFELEKECCPRHLALCQFKFFLPAFFLGTGTKPMDS